jgi:hypothetical protein
MAIRERVSGAGFEIPFEVTGLGAGFERDVENDLPRSVLGR